MPFYNQNIFLDCDCNKLFSCLHSLFTNRYIDGLVQERRSSIANAL